MKRWYVVQSEIRSETYARDELRRGGFDAFLPLERKLGRDRHTKKPTVVDRPLFTGYLFVSLDLDDDDWPEVNRTRGVRRLLPLHRERPLPTSSRFVENLLAKDIERSQLTLDDLLGHSRRKRRSRFATGTSVKASLAPGDEYEEALTYEAIVKADEGERIRLLIGTLEAVVPAGKVRAA